MSTMNKKMKQEWCQHQINILRGSLSRLYDEKKLIEEDLDNIKDSIANKLEELDIWKTEQSEAE